MLVGEDSEVWFLCPHLDYPENSINLGFIVDSAYAPANALNRNSVLEPVGATKSSQNGYDITRRNMSGQGPIPKWLSHFPPFEKFLRTKGFGCEIEMRDYSKDLVQFDCIDTLTFMPAQEYLQQAVRDGDVQAFLDGSDFEAELYIITGLKIAKGLRSSSHPSDAISEWSGHRATVKPGIEVATDWRHSCTFQIPLDMVFAFQLKKLKLEPDNPEVGLDYAWVAGLNGVIIEDANDGDTEHRHSTLVWHSIQNTALGALSF
jgi:hypothetical protein